MVPLRLLLLVLTASLQLIYCVDIITTIAGTGTAGYSGDTESATSATLNFPLGIAIDSSGNVFFTEFSNHILRKITVATGIISTYAGTGTASYSGDGDLAISAGLNQPNGLCIDNSGNIYISDFSNNRVRKIAVSTSMISTIAGTGTASYSGDDGLATSASFYYPEAVAVDASGNVYIVDQYNNRIRKVTSATSIVTTIAGTGKAGYSGDGDQATSADIEYPAGINLDSANNVYFGDFQAYNVIRKITVATGIISTVAGVGSKGGYNGDNMLATEAYLNCPHDVVVDSYDNLYICDRCNSRVRKVDAVTGLITTVVGTGESSSTGDGSAATAATINGPAYSRFDNAGNYYITECNGNRVKKVIIVSTEIPTLTPSFNPTYYPSLSPHAVSIMSTIAGTGAGSYSGDGDQATNATINTPLGLAFDSSGNLYFNDHANHRVRKIVTLTGIITTYAGTGSAGYNGDNMFATSAMLNWPNGLCIDTSDNLYIGDGSNYRIRKVLSSTRIQTIAGNGTAGYGGDNGPSTSAAVYYAFGVAVDTLGNVYISDELNNRVRKIAASTGFITTIAGNGTAGYSGDGGQATGAMIVYPVGINLDSAGNVYFGCNLAGGVIRKITVSSGVISTVVGTASTSGGYNGDNILATAATLNVPFDVVLDSYDNLYVCDRYNYRVRKVDMSTGIITTVVGTGISSSAVDGSITTSTSIKGACYSRFDSVGDYYISECDGNRLRKITVINTDVPTPVPSAMPTSSPTLSPTSSPTSSPTLSPTSSPTKEDIVNANLLDMTLDAEVAKVKVQYYLGAFVAYFLAIYICLYMFSFLRYGSITSMKLYDDSYQSEAHTIYCSITDEQMSKASILSDLYRKNEIVLNNMKLEEDLKRVKEAASSKDKGLNEEVSKYSRGYREYMHQQRTLLGCSPFLYPDGCVIKIPFTSREIRLPPGRVEDILLFLCHNHPLFSCFYFMDGSKLGAHGTRILYIGKEVSVFVLYQFSNMLLQYFMLDGVGLGVFINLFLIAPSAVSMGLLLKHLYTCPCTETVEFQRKYAKYQYLLLLLGRLAIIPIMLVMFVSLLFACLFSSGRRIPIIISKYFLFVQFYGILLAIAKAMLLFVDDYYYQLSVLGILDILCIGRRYKERIIAEKQVVDVDFAFRVNMYLLGLVKVQKILNRDDAIKAKWITASPDNYDIEMKGTGSSIDDHGVVQNPLSTDRGTISLRMDAIYGTSLDEEGEGNSIDAVVENPIFSSMNSFQNMTNKSHGMLRLQETVNYSTTADETNDNETALYEEYRNLQMQQDDSEYDISFEDWRLAKKQFRQGTRGSFVRAFQVFEEREQLHGDDSNKQSASVLNTIKLHSMKVKNVLAANPAARNQQGDSKSALVSE